MFWAPLSSARLLDDERSVRLDAAKSWVTAAGHADSYVWSSQPLDSEAAATLFIGTVQGLVMQSLLAGDVKRLRRDAPRVFAIYRRGIARQP